MQQRLHQQASFKCYFPSIKQGIQTTIAAWDFSEFNFQEYTADHQANRNEI